MIRKFKLLALAGVLMISASPAFAEDMMAPLMAPLAGMDMDPLHIFTPAPAPAAAPVPMMKKHHMMKKHMMKKKKMMKKM